MYYNCYSLQCRTFLEMQQSPAHGKYEASAWAAAPAASNLHTLHTSRWCVVQHLCSTGLYTRLRLLPHKEVIAAFATRLVSS
jgi:hypothetical protein